MKHLLFPAFILLFAAGCQSGDTPVAQNGTPAPAGGNNTGRRFPDSGRNSRFIPIDTANRMIQSYLDGINYKVNTGEIRSLIVNADSLRAYIDRVSAAGKDTVKYVKLMFAHTQEYMNSGNEGKRPDSNSNAITLIIAGVDENGNYVYRKGQVLDHCAPCPNSCLPSGSASENLLIKQ